MPAFPAAGLVVRGVNDHLAVNDRSESLCAVGGCAAACAGRGFANHLAADSLECGVDRERPAPTVGVERRQHDTCAGVGNLPDDYDQIGIEKVGLIDTDKFDIQVHEFENVSRPTNGHRLSTFAAMRQDDAVAESQIARVLDGQCSTRLNSIEPPQQLGGLTAEHAARDESDHARIFQEWHRVHRAVILRSPSAIE